MQKQWIAMAVGMMLLTGCGRNEKVPQTTASPLKEAREVTGETTSFGTPVVSVSLRDGGWSRSALTKSPAIRRKKHWAINI